MHAQHSKQGDQRSLATHAHEENCQSHGGEVYARDVDPKSYLVSPVYGSLRDLAPVTLFIGTRDILYPDCRKLRDQAAAEGARLDYREYDQMVHNWMPGPMPEAKRALAEIVETISSDGRR